MDTTFRALTPIFCWMKGIELATARRTRFNLDFSFRLLASHPCFDGPTTAFSCTPPANLWSCTQMAGGVSAARHGWAELADPNSLLLPFSGPVRLGREVRYCGASGSPSLLSASYQSPQY